MSRLAGVPFRITSETTGESHVIVTDENGYASTAAEWNKHTHKTNANDTAAEEDLDSEAGIWFGLAKDGKTVPANDKLGALPYDTYTVEELRCAANEGFVLVKIEGITVNMLSGYGWVAALLVVAAVAGAGYAGKQYLDARKEKDGDADGGES